MTKRLVEDNRASVVYLNYANSVEGAVNPNNPMGPNNLGENLWPVDISDDGKTVGFSFTAPVRSVV